MNSDPPSSQSNAASTPPLPPPRVPDHELLRRIGRGAYGEVWLARSVTGAFRAVKIVHRASFDHDRPFEREFEGIQKFEPVSRGHDSQVDILHVGRGEDCFYYVMELADDQATGGQINPDHYAPRTLKSDLLFQGRLPFEECVRIGLALTTALENLHGNGLVHRDVKPSNIIFVNGVPKLADIGLVTGVDATRSHVGTEGFAAPEGPGTAQADLYSLGKVLYEASTGKDRQEFPDLPTQLRELPDREGLVELNAVIARACRHDPKDRYPSASAMRTDLELLQSGKSLARIHRLEKRLRTVRHAGAVVTVVAVLALGAWLYQSHQTDVVRRLAVEKTQLADEKTKLANTNARLAEENRQRLVRLDVANGVRLLDADDYSGALLWFADALPLLTNNPAEEAIHRIRIQQVLSQSPRLLQVKAHDANVSSGAFSPDSRHVATGTAKGELCIWDAESGVVLVGPLNLGKRICDLRFTTDGQKLLARSISDQGRASERSETDGFAVVVNAKTGLAVFPLVTNAVRTAFSPDARWLAVARTNLAIEVLDASDGRHIVALTGHTNEITMLSFSRDGSLLASASRDQTVRLWRMPSGEPVGPPIRHSQPVVRAVFSPDTRRLATATEVTARGKLFSIQTWEVTSGAEIGSPILATNRFRALAFDEATGRRLISGDGLDHTVSVWDADTHAAIFPPLRFEASVARCLAFSSDGVRFAAGSDDGTTCVWNLESGEPLTPRLRHVGWVESVHFSPDGTRLLTTSDDGTAKVWDLAVLPEAAKPLGFRYQLAKEDPAFFPHALNPDGHSLIVSLEDNGLRLINLATLAEDGGPIPTPEDDFGGCITFDHNGYHWAAALGLFRGNGHSRSVSLWRRDGDQVHSFTLAHPQPVRVLQFNRYGTELFTLGDDGALRTWQTKDGTLTYTQQMAGTDGLWPWAISPEGKVAIFQRKTDGTMELFDLEKPQAGLVPLAGNAQINMCAFSPDGTRLAGVSGDQYVRIWGTRTGELLTPPFKHVGSLSWVEWSSDGQRAVTAGLSSEVRLWEVAAGEALLAPMGVSFASARVAHFSPDGRFLVVRNDDHLARVWDAATAEPVTPILRHAGEIRAAMITVNNRLVTVSEPSVIHAWDLSETSLPQTVIADYARLVSGRRLDRAGVLQPLKPAELGVLGRDMRSKYPQLFTTPTEQIREWHRRQIVEPTTLGEVASGSFHLERLAKLGDTDPWVRKQQEHFRACRIPPRDPTTPANLVDLTDVYTHSIAMMPAEEFVDLPQGVHSLAGTAFDLRGIICLVGTIGSVAEGRLGSLPLTAVRNIQVRRRCRQLQFLQAADGGGGTDGEEVARWVIHYADGSTREWPLIYGEHVREWWLSTGGRKEATKAVIAWEGHSPIATKQGATNIRLFKATWTNPQPDVEITRLDFVLGKEPVRPFVVAITAE